MSTTKMMMASRPCTAKSSAVPTPCIMSLAPSMMASVAPAAMKWGIDAARDAACSAPAQEARKDCFASTMALSSDDRAWMRVMRVKSKTRSGWERMERVDRARQPRKGGEREEEEKTGFSVLKDDMIDTSQGRRQRLGCIHTTCMGDWRSDRRRGWKGKGHRDRKAKASRTKRPARDRFHLGPSRAVSLACSVDSALGTCCLAPAGPIGTAPIRGEKKSELSAEKQSNEKPFVFVVALGPSGKIAAWPVRCMNQGSGATPQAQCSETGALARRSSGLSWPRFSWRQRSSLFNPRSPPRPPHRTTSPSGHSKARTPHDDRQGKAHQNSQHGGHARQVDGRALASRRSPR